jgi:16S rRNA (uracil1498-N3)-methyltransferase
MLAVGPEGGFSAEEKARAAHATFVPAGLGPLVLRSETAGLAALAVVLHVNGELG